MALRTLSSQILDNPSFLKETMRWIDRHFENRKDKYLLLNCHGDTKLDDSLHYSTSIFPVQLPDGSIKEAKPIFFFDEKLV